MIVSGLAEPSLISLPPESHQVQSRVSMDNPIQVDLGRIAQDLQIRRVQVESVVQLLDEGNTVPFITRYRKERTGNLNEVTIREIQLRVNRLRELAERKETILKAIEGQGKLTPDLAAAIRAADNPKRLEDLYLPFKPKKRSKASDARDRGLEPLAFRVWTRDETLTDLHAAAQEFVNAEKGVESVEKVLEGVGHILAEAISEMAMVRDAVRKVVWKTGKIVTSKAEIPEGQGLEYRDYFAYSEPVAQIPPHRVLAINRGDKEGPLKVRLEVSRPEVEAALFGQLPLESHPQAELFRGAALDALDRLILPSMEREVRRDLTEAAEKHAVEVFARNLGSLLLQPPIPKQPVLAIDPGFKTGCKVTVLDPSGNLLDQVVIYPNAPHHRRSEAKLVLKDLVGKHRVGVVAIGNGTACRETEELVAEIIAEGTRFSQAGASAAPAPAPAESRAETAAAPTLAPATAAEAAATPPAAAIEPSQAQAPSELAAQAIEDQAAAPTPTGEDHAAPPTTTAGEPPPGPPSEAPSPPGDHALLPGPDGNSHVPAESHPAPAPEAPIEMLPPISGGAPDPAPAETDHGVIPPAGPASSSEVVGTAVLDDNAREGEVPEGPDPIRSPGGSTAPEPTAPADLLDVAREVEPTPAQPQLGEDEPPGEPPVREGEGSVQPPEQGRSDSPGGSSAPEPAAATAAAPPAAEAAPPPKPASGSLAGTPPGAPPRSGKPSGHGRSDRSRPPRPKPAPAPPQTPPEPHPADGLLAQLAYVIVNEAGASVYSTSQIGRDELPDYDPTLRSSISIGRRLQDPLAELVKIEPQNIGVGLYQHDVNPKHLKETLEAVIASCVNFVGVDLNTASVPLLRHVSGLNQLTARRIVEYRKDHGRFARREQLMEVDGVGPATFTQAAGFLKISEGEHPLDRTWVHPESYPAATQLLERFGFTPDVVRDKVRLEELRAQLAQADVPALAAELGVGEFTLRDIIEALSRPERDPREDLPKPIFKKGVLKLEDLTAGMELKGTVLNVVDFGAFVDIGLKDSGLVHISQLANRYVKSPHDVVSVGDVVTVWVMGVDQERKRVSLTMVKPGTERHRGAPGGPRRGGGPGGEPRDRDRQGRGPGPAQARRGGESRGPRPTGSALTSPPVGAPSVAVLAETPSRRPDRDRDRDHPRDRSGTAASAGGPRPGEAPGAYPRRGEGPGPGAGPRPGPSGPRGPRPGHGPGGGRPPRPQEQGGPSPRPSRPSRPSPPPPPLSKDALAGNVPLRTFGQLKQLWEARSEGPPEEPPQPQPQPVEPALPAAQPQEVRAQDQTPTPTEPAAPSPEPAPQPHPETPADSV